LEDDAVTEDNFLFQVKRTICELEGLEWDFIDFGRHPIDQDDTDIVSISPSCTTLGYSYQAHCTLYNMTGVEAIKTLDIEKDIIPYDEFLGAVQNIHPRSDVNNLYPICIKIMLRILQIGVRHSRVTFVSTLPCGNPA
jgi:hypothetical protein